jgi:GNAT superfamily N-acetyltransferase
MLGELPLERLRSLASAFPGPHLRLVLASILAGNTAGQLWQATQAPEAPALLLWDQGNNVFYFAGDASAAAQQELAQLIASQLGLRARAERSLYFKARALTPGFEACLGALFGAVALREMPGLFYGVATPQPPAAATPAIPGIEFAPIDQALLADARRDPAARVRAEIRAMWGAEARFFERGFGYAALAGGEIICWCTAEYVSADRCGIGIETVAEYQRRGVATATAARFLRMALERGIQPFWECRADNRGSQRVAEKLGLELLASERYWVGMFGE